MNMTDDLSYNIKNYRAVVSGDLVKVYNEKTSISIDSPISFDSMKEEFSSIDYLLSSIVSEIILSMQRLGKKREEILQDIEAKASLTIANPLYLLNVYGYEDESYIEDINIDIYFFSFLTGEDLDSFLEEALARTLIYNTFKDKIRVNFKTVL